MKYMTILLAIILTVGLMVGCAQKPPTITKVDPAIASATGGMEITITGTGFKAVPVPTVKIGEGSATGVKVVNKTTLKATVPPGTPGPADIVITNAKAKVKSLPSKLFSYYEDVAATTSIPDMATAPDGIDAPAKIDVTFNQEVDATALVIKVVDAASAEVVGKVAPDATDPTKVFSWAPDAPIKAGDYTLTVSGAKGTVAPAMAEMSAPFKVKEAAKPAKKGKK